MTIRITKKRQQILDVLKNTHGTMTAAQLHESLSDIDLATIYRNLDLFVQEKIIKRIHLDEGEAQFEYQKEPHHHAVCSDCSRVVHFKAPDDKIKKMLGLEDFEIDEMEVLVKGRCKEKN